MPAEPRSFREILNDISNSPVDPDSSRPEEETYADHPVADEAVLDILLHREAHFGGSFELMLEYYQAGGKGIQPDFSLEQIHQFAVLEKQMEKNLAAEMLSGSDAEQISRVREVYRSLREICQDEEAEGSGARLIADLVLSEGDSETEIQAIMSAGSAVVDDLIALLRSEEFLNPLFPGYGEAPDLAAICLGRLKSEQAIIPLFEMLGHVPFQTEESVLSALREIGVPSRKFLEQVLGGRPVTQDTQYAAMALVGFKDRAEVAQICFRHLLDIKDDAPEELLFYLLLGCEGLVEPDQRARFALLQEDPALAVAFEQDMASIVREWGMISNEE